MFLSEKQPRENYERHLGTGVSKELNTTARFLKRCVVKKRVNTKKNAPGDINSRKTTDFILFRKLDRGVQKLKNGKWKDCSSCRAIPTKIKYFFLFRKLGTMVYKILMQRCVVEKLKYKKKFYGETNSGKL